MYIYNTKYTVHTYIMQKTIFILDAVNHNSSIDGTNNEQSWTTVYL